MLTLLLSFSLGCKSEPEAPAGEILRLDERFDTAQVQAAPAAASASASLAEPITWDFNSVDEITSSGWDTIRGAMGFRDGSLIVKGGGASPVAVSPTKPPIDWSRYESVEIRLMAEGGSEVKIKLGKSELTQKLGPAKKFKIYRFDLENTGPNSNLPLMVMPTDGVSDLAAIDFIKLEPRKVLFPAPAGRLRVGKAEQYRNAIYTHAPATVQYKFGVPEKGSLHFGIAAADAGKPVQFEVLAGDEVVFSQRVDNAENWQDAAVDLSRFAGRQLNLTLRTESDSEGAVGLWANPAVTTAAPKNRPNVLLYMVDTLRADHTSVNGYTRDTTPFLKTLAAEGVVFEDCQVQATWTKPSVASMMTSLYSLSHAIYEDSDVIPRGAATLAETMRAGGYTTASFTGNPFAGKATGLDRGFDYMAEYPAIQSVVQESDRATDSAALNRLVLPWLERHAAEPFFLYVHSTDPHAPYRPPADAEAQFADPAQTQSFNRDEDRLRRMRQYGGAVFQTAEARKRGIDPEKFIAQALDRYDAEIAHNDRSIRQLIAKLRETGELENTLIMVVSDHGEEFLEHGWTGHGHSLYSEQMHGLFLMWNPKLLGEPRRVPEPVQLIDLMPTVLELTGLAAPATIEGQSLAPLVRGKPFERLLPVMSSRLPHANLTGNPVPENRVVTIARIDSDWKLIYRERAKPANLPEVELYDRQADRAELRNMAAERHEIVDRWLPEIQKWADGRRELTRVLGPTKGPALDAKTLERLRSLGYVGGSGK